MEGETAAVRMDQVTVQPGGAAAPAHVQAPPTRNLPKEVEDVLPPDWVEERLIDDGGEEIKIRYRGKASLDRYKFIRDYLDFKIERAGKSAAVKKQPSDQEPASR